MSDAPGFVRDASVTSLSHAPLLYDPAVAASVAAAAPPLSVVVPGATPASYVALPTAADHSAALGAQFGSTPSVITFGSAPPSHLAAHHAHAAAAAAAAAAAHAHAHAAGRLNSDSAAMLDLLLAPVNTSAAGKPIAGITLPSNVVVTANIPTSSGSSSSNSADDGAGRSGAAVSFSTGAGASSFLRVWRCAQCGHAFASEAAYAAHTPAGTGCQTRKVPRARRRTAMQAHFPDSVYTALMEPDSDDEAPAPAFTTTAQHNAAATAAATTPGSGCGAVSGASAGADAASAAKSAAIAATAALEDAADYEDECDGDATTTATTRVNARAAMGVPIFTAFPQSAASVGPGASAGSGSGSGAGSSSSSSLSGAAAVAASALAIMPSVASAALAGAAAAGNAVYTHAFAPPAATFAAAAAAAPPAPLPSLASRAGVTVGAVTAAKRAKFAAEHDSAVAATLAVDALVALAVPNNSHNKSAGTSTGSAVGGVTVNTGISPNTANSSHKSLSSSSSSSPLAGAHPVLVTVSTPAVLTQAATEALAQAHSSLAAASVASASVASAALAAAAPASATASAAAALGGVSAAGAAHGQALGLGLGHGVNGDVLTAGALLMSQYGSVAAGGAGDEEDELSEQEAELAQVRVRF